MRKIVIIAAVCALTVASVSACQTVKKTADIMMSGAEDISSSQTDVELYNNYVDFYNFMASGGSFHSAVDSYFDGVEDAEEFAAKEDGSYISYAFSDIDRELADNVMAQAEKGTDFTDVDAAAKLLVPTVKEIMDVLDEAASYGNQQGYNDDNYAKAAELHTRFYPLLSTYIEQEAGYTTAINALAQKRNEEQKQRLLDEGFTIGYGMLDIMDSLRMIDSAIYSQTNVNSSNITELDISEIEPLYNELAEKVAKFTEDSKDTAQIEKEGFDADFNDVDDFADSAAEVKISVYNIIDRVKNNKPLSEIELQLGDLTDGSLENFNKTYGELINIYNGL